MHSRADRPFASGAAAAAGTRGSLDGRVAVITGGSGGIGAAIATDFVGAGARVVFGYRSGGTRAVDLVRRLDKRNARAIHVEAGSGADADRLATLAEDAFGGVDILVTAAGTLEERSIDDTDFDFWSRTLEVNLTGTYLAVRSLLGCLRNSSHASIVLVSSQVAYTGSPGYTAYAAAKAGVLGFMRSLARELAPHIRVNAVAPGPVETELIAGLRSPAWDERKFQAMVMRRFGQPAEVAAAVRFLASDEASFFTGQTLCPNGGGAMQ
jgi:3-oxoacyl-[acyl-carrier protein] reductase